MSPRTVDHIVETHEIATSRRLAGLPVWAHRLDVSGVFRSEELTFEERRDAIVSCLRCTEWVANDPDELAPLVEELADTEDPDGFDAVWDDIYDLADYDRVWIKTS